MVQACEMGLHAIGIDVSAFNALIGNCKVLKYEIADVIVETKRITESLKQFVFESHIRDFDDELTQNSMSSTTYIFLFLIISIGCSKKK